MVLIYTDRLETGINLLQPLKLLFYQNSTVHIQPTLFYQDSQHSPHSTHSVLPRQPALSALKLLCSTKTASTVHIQTVLFYQDSTVHTQTTLFYQDSQHSSHSNYSILPRQLAQFTLKLLCSTKTASTVHTQTTL